MAAQISCIDYLFLILKRSKRLNEITEAIEELIVNIMNNIDIKMPGLWYDVYARLLPGISFIGCLYVLLWKKCDSPTAVELIVVVIIGYICGLITQPISVNIVTAVERVSISIYDSIKNNKRNSGLKIRRKYLIEVDYVDNVIKQIEGYPVYQEILHKMHAELTFYCQSSIFSLILCIIVYNVNECSLRYFGVPVIFILMALETALRRLRRATKYFRLFNADK